MQAPVLHLLNVQTDVRLGRGGWSNVVMVCMRGGGGGGGASHYHGNHK